MNGLRKTRSKADEKNLMLGLQVKEARLDLNYSQKKLGESVGITYQQVQKQELGKNRISAVYLFEYSLFLKKPIEYFYEPLVEKYSPTYK